MAAAAHIEVDIVPPSEAKNLAHELELATADRDRALQLLEGVVRIVNVGGYMEHNDQVTLRVAIAMLAHHGRDVTK